MNEIKIVFIALIKISRLKSVINLLIINIELAIDEVDGTNDVRKNHYAFIAIVIVKSIFYDQ